MKPLLTAAVSAALSLSLHAQDAPVSYRAATRDGRAAIVSSTDETVDWHCYGLAVDLSLDDWKQKQSDLISAGVHLFQLNLWDLKAQYWDQTAFFSVDGKPVTGHDTISWSEQAPWLIEQDPQARFVMRFGLIPLSGFREAHPDDFQPLGGTLGGKRDGMSINPSPASDLYLERVVLMIRDVVAWCESQPWRDRVVGYTLFPYCEGATEVGIFDVLFDTSPVMQVAFREFVREKYPSDAALKSAWADTNITFDAVAVPTKPEWEEKRRRLKLLHWPDPARVQRERDYFLLQKRLFHRFWTTIFDTVAEATAARPVLKGYDTLKQHMQGWMHNGDFDAKWSPGELDSYTHILLASGCIETAPLLDHPGIDMLQTPGMYYNRAVGYAWEAEGLSDALALRGKFNYMEADMRTWVRKTWRGAPMKPGVMINDSGVFMTPGEMDAGFARTLAWALSRNQMYYYMAVSGGNHWFNDPRILQTVQSHGRIMRASRHLPWANTQHAVCLVVDDGSALYEDYSSGYQYLAVYRQIEEGLALCGIPYRIHLLSDLARDDFPDYKCYLFPNLFRVDADVESMLHNKVLRNGNVAIFGPATGITDGNTLSAAAASRLLGTEMELVQISTPRRVILQDHGHPLSRGLETRTYGGPYAYGPVLAPSVQRLPANGRAVPIGAAFYHYFFDRPGPFVTDFGLGADGSPAEGERGPGDYAVVFSPAVPLPPELIRECARYAGCNVWSEENAVVYAADNMVALHTVRSGEHTLHLPRKTAVWDMMTGDRVARRTDELRVSLDAPATALYFLGDRLPDQWNSDD